MYLNETVERMMKEEGSCPDVSSIGGYTLIYFDKQDNVMCGGCATKNAKDIVALRTYDEGAAIECTDCGEQIESSYGEPEE